MRYEIIERYIDFLVSKSTPDCPVWNVENIRFGRKPKWNYIDGCMMTFFLEYAKIKNESKYAEYADNFIDFYVMDDGTLRGCDLSENALDDINEGKVLFELVKTTGKKKYAAAIDKLKAQLDRQPRTKEGSYFHKAIYPNQVWLDGIYMALVFEAMWQREHDEDYTDVEMQLKNVRKRMFDEEKGLYYHAYDETKAMFWADKTTGTSKNFWLRAIGWFAAALADISEIAAGSGAGELASELLSELVAGILKYQDPETGMYYQVVDCGGKDGNYLETSGSAMIAYAMLKGVRLGLLDEKYREAGRQTFDGIVKKYLKETDDGITLGGICLVAGVGPASNLRRDGTFAYYISEPVVENEAKGTAPLLLAYTEILRLDHA